MSSFVPTSSYRLDQFPISLCVQVNTTEEADVVSLVEIDSLNAGLPISPDLILIFTWYKVGKFGDVSDVVNMTSLRSQCLLTTSRYRDHEDGCLFCRCLRNVLTIVDNQRQKQIDNIPLSFCFTDEYVSSGFG